LKGSLKARWFNCGIRRKIKWYFKSRYRILSQIFVVILVIPTVTHPVLKNILSTEREGLNENRNLSKFEFSFQNFGANFENFYQDNFPFRNSLIPLYNKYYNKINSKYFAENTEYNIELDIDESIKNELIILEEHVKNELAVADKSVKNELVIAEEPVKNDLKIEEIGVYKKIADMLVNADNYFKSLNKKIIFQVCPKKDKITKPVTGRSELELLSLYIEQNSNVSFSYPINKYLEIEPHYKSYDMYNSHHNFLGAYVSWQDIQKKAEIETIDIGDIDITAFEIDVRKIITTPYNINCCYPYNQDLPAVRKTEYIKSINYNVAYKPDIRIETLHNSGCYQLEFKSSNINGQTIFITGDSFLETQLQYAIKDFEFSNISHLYNYDAGSKSQAYRSRIKNYIERADVIVVVIGENNLLKDDLEHNPGLEYRIALILELAGEIYR